MLFATNSFNLAQKILICFVSLFPGTFKFLDLGADCLPEMEFFGQKRLYRTTFVFSIRLLVKQLVIQSVCTFLMLVFMQIYVFKVTLFAQEAPLAIKLSHLSFRKLVVICNQLASA